MGLMRYSMWIVAVVCYVFAVFVLLFVAAIFKSWCWGSGDVYGRQGEAHAVILAVLGD